MDAAAEERRRREYSGKRERIDIRTIKREERIRRLANRPLESVLKSEKRSILNHLLDKMEATAEATEADLIEAEKEADRVEAAIKKEQPDILNTSSGKIFLIVHIMGLFHVLDGHNSSGPVCCDRIERKFHLFRAPTTNGRPETSPV